MKTTLRKSTALVLGHGAFIGDLLREVECAHKAPYRIIGVVAPRDQAMAYGYGNQVLGDIGDLRLVLDQHGPEVIIVGSPYDRSVCCMDQLLMEAKCGRKIRVEHADDVYERLTGKLPIEAIAPQQVIYGDLFRPSAPALMLNRCLSCVIALAGLVSFLPLMLVIAALIKLDSPGPLFFVQKRCGEGGKSFSLLKFRTMSATGAGRSEWAGDNQHRITRVGHWLRRFRLDELPQFLNVLRGDMNLVGPRPHPACNYPLLMLVARNTPECGVQIPFYNLRCNVRPGITGWAQVRYRYANNLSEEIEKLRFDLYYLKHYSVWLDLRIIAETAWIVVAGHRSSPADSALATGPRLAISK